MQNEMYKRVNDVYERAIEFYGVDNQLFQLCEELAELIKAVNKWRRNRKLAEIYPAYRDDVTEEIADVEIMIDQLIMMLDISYKDLFDIKYSKINRLAERIREDKKENERNSD